MAPPEPPPLEHLYSLLLPYLPTSIPTTLTSVLPLLITFLTLYAALYTLYTSLRLFLRPVFLALKYGTVVAAVIGVMSAAQGGGTMEGTMSLKEGFGTVFEAGKSGWNWWNGNGGTPWEEMQKRQERSSSRSSTTKKQGRRRTVSSSNVRTRQSKRSASGRPRTWSTVNEEGEYDDPLGKVNEGLEDVMEWVKGAVGGLGLGRGEEETVPAKKTGKGKRATKPKGKRDGGGLNLGGWAMGYAERKVRRAWGDLTGQ